MPEIEAWRTAAHRIADDVLFPAASEVDGSDRVPRSHLDLLAAEGFYGISASPQWGGVGFERFDVVCDVVAALAGGCLATTFVWLQHLGPVMSVAASHTPGLRDSWLGPLARGDRRAGIALAGLRPGTEQVRIEPAPGGYRVYGETAWVTGWGLIDVVHLAGRDDADLVHFLLVDAAETPTLTVRPAQLMAVQASSTVTVRFDGHFVPADRLTQTQSGADWAAGDAAGSPLNGFLAIGVADRCGRLMESTALLENVERGRSALLAAESIDLPSARAQASLLASRAATELMVRTGSRGVLSHQHAGRLFREAGFLLVFGSRPAIREELLSRIG